ncbi:bacteriophage T4 gp5 trimerisation domain-containing protein, partial [Pseudomonas sp. NPDC096950]|uniref:bacteriophage T4 gp5 trimerisation domain-containing protein n=1 Tax=Pseudomonas sp. NPDC096950 TaxID=3364485 RepID=UPI003839E466
QRDIEQLILNDSDTQVGNDRREQISRDSHSLIGRDRFEQVDNHSASLIKGDETHTTQGLRNTVIGSDELISIGGNSSTTAAGTLVIQAGPHARVTASQVVIDAGTSLILTAGGHHLVINAGGIFSSVAIVEGGSPVAGLPPLLALSAEQVTSAAKEAPLLPQAQRLALMAKQPICAVCEAAKQQSEPANV